MLTELELLDAKAQSTIPSLHKIFRYPAKFHPPVARALVERYTEPGEVVLDPFCGSGTLLSEALTLDRSAIGSDIDPVAVEISYTKSAPIDPETVREALSDLRAALTPYERTVTHYSSHEDIATDQFEDEVIDVADWVPPIPNIHHWFRRYVIVDLAHIRREIHNLECGSDVKRAINVAFGASIRNSSNADPVPVSGLEVTSHMRRLEERGRVVSPFANFHRTATRLMRGVSELASARGDGVASRVLRGDATQVHTIIDSADAIITSPPYHNAVDYYRRHNLEMYWMGLVADYSARLDLLPGYIGRPRVPRSTPRLQGWEPPSGLVAEWSQQIRAANTQRATDFDHYMASMEMCFSSFARVLPREGRLVLVVANSTWNGEAIPTASLFEQLANPYFQAAELLSYPLRNRYMSYSRHNGADIHTELVLSYVAR